MDFIRKLILQKKSVRLQGVHRQVRKVQQIHQKLWCKKAMFQNKWRIVANLKKYSDLYILLKFRINGF